LLSELFPSFPSLFSNTETLAELIELTEIFTMSDLSAGGIILPDLSVTLFDFVQEKWFASVPVNFWAPLRNTHGNKVLPEFVLPPRLEICVAGRRGQQHQSLLLDRADPVPPFLASFIFISARAGANAWARAGATETLSTWLSLSITSWKA
jgi:hypothetical protein